MKTKTVSVSELSGAALDWAVAIASGLSVTHELDDVFTVEKGTVSIGFVGRQYIPSTDWSQAGPLIADFGVSLVSAENCGDFVGFKGWGATTDAVVLLVEAWGHPRVIQQEGPTPLIAAMRAIVASKIGDTVEVPEELL